MSKQKYEICIVGDEWEVATKATTRYMQEGWLHYELRDGTIGLSRPGTWRVKPDVKKFLQTK